MREKKPWSLCSTPACSSVRAVSPDRCSGWRGPSPRFWRLTSQKWCVSAAPAFADRFLTHMLTRNIRIEEDLLDQLFNSTEKRLARTLLLLARYGEPEASHRAFPKVSQEVPS